MKSIKNLISLLKERRSSEIDYNNSAYNYSSFFKVLLYRMFNIIPKNTDPTRMPPGDGFLVGRSVILKAPISYLISFIVFANSTGRIMMRLAINGKSMLSEF